MKSRREIWLQVAVSAMFLGACAAEDSVAPPVQGNTGGTGSGGMGNSGSGGGSGAGMSGVGGAGVGGGGGMMPGGSGSSGGSGGTMAGSGGVGSGGAAGNESGGSGGTSGTAGGTAQDADCDMNGLWATRMLTITDAIDLDQCASMYSFYELRHDGANVEVVNHFNCGIFARGTGNTDFSTKTREALIAANRQVGRKGTVTKGEDGTCQLSFEPFWATWGLDPAMYLPAERNSPQTLQQMQSMTPMPMEATAPGVIDVEGDGSPGLAFVVSGSPSDGTRHGIQRNVQTWTTDDFYKITPSMDWTEDIQARATFYGEEIALEATNLFLYTVANPLPNADAARVTMRFLGRDASDARAQGILVSTDAADLAGALQTCENIVSAMEVIAPVLNYTPQRCPCPDGMPSDAQRVCPK